MIQRTIVPGIIVFLALFAISACDTNTEPECVIQPGPTITGPEARVVADADFTTTSSGLKYFDFTVGNGVVAGVGDTLFVDYTGWLTDGTIFDSSVYISSRAPFGLIIGETGVISGWTEGLQGMQEGGQRQLVIPAGLAYGSSCRSPIPPGSTLIFEVEVVRLRDGG